MTTPPKADELAACPFCRVGFVDLGGYGRGVYCVVCKGCGAQTKFFHRKRDAIAAWNQRTPSPSINAGLADEDDAPTAYEVATRGAAPGSLDPTLSYGCGHEHGKKGKAPRGSSPEYEDGYNAGAALRSPPATGCREAVLEALAGHRNWELSYEYGDEEPGAWKIHSVNGGINDREWTLIGQGETPELALRRALKAPTTGNQGGEANDG